jgi:hypothetical protein
VGATTIISAVGLVFAAAAAWAAWMTVRMMRHMRREENLRRMIDVVLSVEHAAEDLDADESNPVRQEQFRAARRGLFHAGALPFMASASFTDLQELGALLDSLTADDAHERPAIVAANARQVAVILSASPPPTRMQRWSVNLQWSLRRIRHPRQRSYIDALRRGWDPHD